MKSRLKKKDIKGTLIMLAVMLVLSFIYVTISPLLSRKSFMVLVLICLAGLITAIAIRRFVFGVTVDEKTKNGKINAIVNDIIFAATVTTWFVTFSYRYSFVGKSGATFLIIAVLIGIAVGIAVLIINNAKGKRFNECWAHALFYIVIVSLFAYTYLANLNYVFDDSVVECSAVIEDKDYVNLRKGRDRYEFTMTVDGEYIELDVGKSTYDKYDIGDTYYFTKYEGAFGVPFYLTGTEK